MLTRNNEYIDMESNDTVIRIAGFGTSGYSGKDSCVGVNENNGRIW